MQTHVHAPLLEKIITRRWAFVGYGLEEWTCLGMFEDLVANS